MAHQGIGDSLDDQVVDSQLDALAFEQRVNLLAPGQRLGHVNGDGHEEVRAGGHALLKPLADHLPHAAPGNQLASGRRLSRRGRRGRSLGRDWRRGRCRRGRWRSLRGSCGGGLWRGRRLLGGQVVFHIQLDDATARASALDLAQVNVVVLGDTSGDGGGFDPPEARVATVGWRRRVTLRLVAQCLTRFATRLGLGGWAGRQLRGLTARRLGGDALVDGRRGRWGLAVATPGLGSFGRRAAVGGDFQLFPGLREQGNGGADGVRLTRLADDPGKRAALKRLNFDIDLASLNFSQDLALRNLLTFLYFPVNDGALGHVVAHLRHHDFTWHGVPPLVSG